MSSRRPTRPTAPALRPRAIEAQAPELADALEQWALPREKVLELLDVDGARHARSLAREIRRVSALLETGRVEDDVDTIEAGLDVLTELRAFAVALLGEEAVASLTYVGASDDATATSSLAGRSQQEPSDLVASAAESVTSESATDATSTASHATSPRRAGEPTSEVARIRLRQTMRRMKAVTEEARKRAASTSSMAKVRVDEAERPPPPACEEAPAPRETPAPKEERAASRDNAPRPRIPAVVPRDEPEWSSRYVDDRTEEGGDLVLVETTPREPSR